MPLSAGESSEQLIPLTHLMATLGILLAFSFFIERLLAVLAVLMDRFEILRRLMSPKTPKDLADRLALLRRADEESALLRSSIRLADGGAEIPFHPAVSPRSEPILRLQPPTPPDALKVRKEFWCHLFGIFIGLAGCYYWRLSFLRLIRVEAMSADLAPRFWEYLLLGVLIGSGSKPIHFLMKYLLTRRIAALKALPEAQSESAPQAVIARPEEQPISRLSLSPSIEEIVGFVYDGGDRPERLEHTHLREQPPDRIIYHHTCLHAQASFADLVRVFDDKGWLTGYHCVVFRDGTIRVLCRWDRIGNHALGYNQRSLGLAFQGNFETGPALPFSNFDGRYGPTTPSEPQLEAGARVIALWCLLYKIPLDFKVILPHRAVADKTCPGSNFPVSRFEKRIAAYYEEWRDDKTFQKALKRFKQLPMVIA
ncbi:MAG: N-acetylmuramoyl-L-alanine amidase [candidate division KSB1 bacterium]|nr:N-acetylmuramoyl-L-alanine amidase [candidate division KSB1 bacterium]